MWSGLSTVGCVDSLPCTMLYSCTQLYLSSQLRNILPADDACSFVPIFLWSILLHVYYFICMTLIVPLFKTFVIFVMFYAPTLFKRAKLAMHWLCYNLLFVWLILVFQFFSSAVLCWQWHCSLLDGKAWWYTYDRQGNSQACCC